MENEATYEWCLLSEVRERQLCFPGRLLHKISAVLFFYERVIHICDQKF